MAEYIDKEKAIKAIEEFAKGMPSKEKVATTILLDGIGLAQHIVSKQPAADMVEVVRCKDCVHHGCENGVCSEIEENTGHQIVTRDDFYCYFGEREEAKQ